MHILLVDDELEILRALHRMIKRHTQHETMMLQGVDTPEELNELSFDLIITDQRMPGLSGTDILHYLASQGHPGKRVLLSAYTDFSDVVSSFNNGEIDRFLSKPVSNNIMLETIQQLLIPYHQHRIAEKSDSSAFLGILTEDPVMEILFDRVKRIAPTDSNIYINGETGTGKELLANAIHRLSPRSNAPFIALNCANLTDELAESQLFGHARGAFTGATKDQTGFLAQADKGTLFLDEVADLSPRVQTKLLRALQEQTFQPLGSTQTITFDARVISAAATPLRRAVADGRFREDLFYRLNVIPLKLPPLRDRHDDKQSLFRHFLSHYSQQQRKPREWLFSHGLEDWINSYQWPGNIRELQNVCAFISSCIPPHQMSIDKSMLPEDIPMNEQIPGAINREGLISCRKPADIKRKELLEALKQNGGNKAKTARQLGVSRMTLYRLIQQQSIEENEMAV